jgi:hypothetical protein
MKTLLTAIEESDDSSELDCLWAVIREKKFGIKRKILCFCLILGLEESEILDQAPKDKDGRILDYESRHIISQSLVKASQKNKN